jgi:hypothetical protein
MIFHDCQQNTEEWLNLRLGHFTASSAKDLFLKPETAGYMNCISRVLYEKKTGVLLSENKYNSKSMDIGHEREYLAIEQYESLTFTKIHNGGFCELNEWIGCSPDGLIGDEGMIQVKCPDFSTIVEYNKTGKLPLSYLRQMQFELMVTGRKWNDFYVFYPLIEPFIIHVERNEELIKDIEKRVNEAVQEVKDLMLKIKLIGE